MNLLGLLGSLEEEWFRANKVVGCPHPHVPSDHFSLFVEFEMPVPVANGRPAIKEISATSNNTHNHSSNNTSSNTSSSGAGKLR
jgi:hypothetical protein